MPSVLNSPRSRLSSFLFLLIMLVPTPHDSGVYFLMLLSIGATATPCLALDAACVGLVLLRQFAPCVLLLPPLCTSTSPHSQSSAPPVARCVMRTASKDWRRLNGKWFSAGATAAAAATIIGKQHTRAKTLSHTRTHTQTPSTRLGTSIHSSERQ